MLKKIGYTLLVTLTVAISAHAETDNQNELDPNITASTGLKACEAGQYSKFLTVEKKLHALIKDYRNSCSETRFRSLSDLSKVPSASTSEKIKKEYVQKLRAHYELTIQSLLEESSAFRQFQNAVEKDYKNESLRERREEPSYYLKVDNQRFALKQILSNVSKIQFTGASDSETVAKNGQSQAAL